jgi:catechol 2,3-dioxygenase-like lactoylglutathione lyase family enzyme
MSEARSPLWNIQPATRLDRRDPYLLLQQVTLFVRDQERGRRFFVDCLGFSVALDYHSPEFGPWVRVAPPDGTARIAFVVPKADSEEHALIGKTRQLVFLTENVEAKYREWKERGVKFDCPPEIAPFGSVVANFEDVDGNGWNPNGEGRRNWKSHRKYRRDFSRKRRQRWARWNARGLVYRRGTWEETTTISLSSAKDGLDSWSAISPVKESRRLC